MNISFKKISKHASHYNPLLGMLAATVLGFYLFSYDKTFQLVLGIAAASGYVSWGLVYHHIHKDLHVSIILEYISIALFGVVILFFILF